MFSFRFKICKNESNDSGDPTQIKKQIVNESFVKDQLRTLFSEDDFIFPLSHKKIIATPLFIKISTVPKIIVTEAEIEGIPQKNFLIVGKVLPLT